MEIPVLIWLEGRVKAGNKVGEPSFHIRLVSCGRINRKRVNETY
jgi:hypothetical protein